MAELYALEGQVGDQRASRAGAPGPGLGYYASYHALWHLKEIGVVSNLTSFESSAWDLAEARHVEGAPPTRVALVDVSVAYAHPNLEPAIAKELMIDFFSSRLGTFPQPAPDDGRLSAFLSRASEKRRLLPAGAVADLFDELCARIPNERRLAREAMWSDPLRVAPTTSPNFSAHGTAMAGLIGARPRGPSEVRMVSAFHIADDGEPLPQPPEGVGFPYAGVDPFCEVVPISTSFDPDPEQLILALLYAWLIDADVIVLARDLADPLRTVDRQGRSDAEILRSYPVEFSDRELALWAALRELTLALSREVPVVCAAGNGSDEPLLYPASLASEEDNGIIAVGARAATGRRAGYSSTGASPGGITVYAPSGDGERLDDRLQRLDSADAGFRPSDHSALYLSRLGVQHGADGRGRADGPSIFATQEIVSTDVPGAAGYNTSAFGRPSGMGGILDYRSYYCHFSGTSAACAIAAGALSLAISAGVLPRDGPTAKRRLGGGAQPDDALGTPYLSWDALAGSR
jgi:hypothetical protein